MKLTIVYWRLTIVDGSENKARETLDFNNHREGSPAFGRNQLSLRRFYCFAYINAVSIDPQWLRVTKAMPVAGFVSWPSKTLRSPLPRIAR